MTKHIPEIDGLRALAVLAVIVFHMNPLILPGGFCGVDIFYVISGYVVSLSLMEAREHSFIKFIFRFYSNRFIRILPSLLLCLTVTSVLSVLFIPQAWMTENIPATAKAAFYGFSNYALANTGDHYYGVRSELNPFTQTWSLGVEEQFYFIFPIFFFIFFLKENLKKMYFPISMLLLISSYSYGLYYFQSKNYGDFYTIFSRLWELMAGVLLAFFHSQHNRAILPNWSKKYFLFLAFFLLVYSLIESSPIKYSAPQGIFPVVASLLILDLVFLFKNTNVFYFLRLSLVRYVGKISYQLYLFHWPVFVLLKWTIGLESYLALGIGLILTFALAVSTFEGIDLNVKLLKSRKPIYVILWFIFLVIILSQISKYFFENQEKFTLVKSAPASDWFPMPMPVPDVNFSRFSDKKLFILGDSHAGAYSTMLKNLQEKDGLTSKIFQRGGCAFPPTTLHLDDSCKSFLDSSINEILSKSSPGDVIFLPGLRMMRLMNDAHPYSESDLLKGIRSPETTKVILDNRDFSLKYLDAFQKKGLILLYEMPKPMLQIMPYRCFDWFNKNNPVCSSGFFVNEQFILDYRRPIVEEIKEISHQYKNVKYWDPVPLLCNGSTCAGRINNHPVYFDSDHLSSYGNMVLLENFRDELKNIFSKNEFINRQSTYLNINMSLSSSPGFGSTGLSFPESWGRWTDGEEVKLIFRFGLPSNFRLILNLNGSSTTFSKAKKATITVGSISHDFTPPLNKTKMEFIFKGIRKDEDTVLIMLPLDKNLIPNAGSDPRRLGLAITSIDVFSLN